MHETYRVKGDSDNYLIPLKAGEDIVTVTVKDNGRQKSKKTYTVYVCSAAFSSEDQSAENNKNKTNEMTDKKSTLIDYKYTLLEDGTAEITKYSGKEDELDIPSELDKHKVSVIGDSAFSSFRSLKSVTIPDSVISIKENAFENCNGLTSVMFGNNVRNIGKNAFKNCSQLTNLTIPDSVTKIDAHAFSSCTRLTSVSIGNGVTYIGAHAFSQCTKIKSIIIPYSVTSIKEYAFIGCVNLKDVRIPDSVTVIGLSAFKNCSKLLNIIVDHGSYAEDYCIKHGIKYEYSEDL